MIQSTTEQSGNEYSEVRRRVLARRLGGVCRARLAALRGGGEAGRWGLAASRGTQEQEGYRRATLEAAEGASVARIRVSRGLVPSESGRDAEKAARVRRSYLEELTRTEAGVWEPEEAQPSFGPSSGGGKRGVITGFSRASRRRMQETLASVPYRAFDPRNLLFVSLTYPADYPDDPRRWQGDLQAFRKRLEREFGGLPGIWKLEPQKRGAPHYHLLLFSADDRVKDAIGEAWHELVGGGDRNHRQHGADCRRVSGWREAMSYLSKYMAKAETFAAGVEVGRIWGVWRRELFGVVWRRWNLDWTQYLKLRRIFRGRIGYRRGRGELQGMLCFLEYGELLRCLAWLGALENAEPMQYRARGPD